MPIGSGAVDAVLAVMTARAVLAVLLLGSMLGHAPTAGGRPLRFAPAEQPAPPPAWLSRGGYVGVALAYSTVSGEPATLVGARGAWMINHHFAVGGAGYGMLTQTVPPAGPDAALHRRSFAYGGLWTEYIVAPRRRVHGSLGLLLGAGGVADHRYGGEAGAGTESDPLLVLDPTLSLEINLADFMRLALSADYRFVRGVDLAALDDRRMTAAGVAILLKLGRF
jgi:hypothetical protein